MADPNVAKSITNEHRVADDEAITVERWLAEQKSAVHALGHDVAVALDVFFANGRSTSAWRKVETAHAAWKDEIQRQMEAQG